MENPKNQKGIRFGAKLFAVLFCCFVVSAIITHWVNDHAIAGALGFFVVLVVSYPIMREIGLSFYAWIGLAGLSGLIIFIFERIFSQ